MWEETGTGLGDRAPCSWIPEGLLHGPEQILDPFVSFVPLWFKHRPCGSNQSLWFKTGP